MLSNRAAIGGILAISAGLLLNVWLADGDSITAYLWFIAAGAILWAVGAGLFALIKEQAGATEGGRNPLQETRAGWELLKTVSAYQQYLIVRSLLLTIEIAAPFYVLLAQQTLSDGINLIGLLLIGIGLANVLSSPFWGYFADTSSRRVLIYSALMGVVTAFYALLFSLLPDAWQSSYGYAVIFVLLGFAEAGVRLGRKTYLIDAVDDQQRATYVTFGNSSIGLVTLAMGGLGLIAQFAGVQVLIGILGMVSLGAVVAAYRLLEVEDFG